VIELATQHRLLNAVPEGMVTVTEKGSSGSALQGSVQESELRLVTEICAPLTAALGNPAAVR
jgi:hypothetical protein